VIVITYRARASRGALALKGEEARAARHTARPENRLKPLAQSSDYENIAGKIEPPGEKLRNVMAASKRSASVVRPTAHAVNQSRLGNA
jgi:hypothetical protein